MAREFRSVPVRSLHIPPPVEEVATSAQNATVRPPSPSRVPSVDVPHINQSQGATPRPLSATRRRPESPSASNRAVPIVNLENFEAYRTSIKTVFNSPRSLAVCAEFGIHSTELLPRAPQDFLGPNVPEAIAAMRYHHFESKRQEKLVLLRNARAEKICSEHQPRAAVPSEVVVKRIERPVICRPQQPLQQLRGATDLTVEKAAKRQLVYERALKAKLEKEQQVIQKQLLAEQRVAAHRHACESEKLKEIELRRLKWSDSREKIEHKRRQMEFQRQKRSESVDVRSGRVVSKWDIVSAKEQYFTPRHREEKRRATSAQR